MARVTIGMPAYNNEATIAASIDSILAQTERDLEIIISVDPSTDRTWEICQAYSAKDSRIRIFRQERQLYYMNFRFVLEHATAPYFAWCACDDVRRPAFVEKCAAMLDLHPEFVCCVSRCIFTIRGKPESISMGKSPLDRDWVENVASFFQNPNVGSRFYGVFRTPALRASFPDRIMHGYDFAVCAAALRYGGLGEIEEALMVRDLTEMAAYARSVQRDHDFVLYRVFPILAMSLYLCRRHCIPLRPKVLTALFALNLYRHESQMQYIYPKTYRGLRPIYLALRQHVLWRM